jgi:hypothetical protein
MPAPTCHISPEIAASIASRIESDGFAVIDDFVDSIALAAAQDFVRSAVASNGGNYLAINGPEQLGGTFLQAIGTDPGFKNLCRVVYETSTGKPAPDAPFYQVLRCLSGALAQSNSLNFHYDSYLLTTLIPIIIPERGKTGDLLMIPNVRGIRSSYLGNLADKILLDNPVTQRLLRRLYSAKSTRIKHIALRPGSLYLFYGYRSIHTNEACDPDAIRSTALLHYVDPHADSRIKSALRRN